jgi:acyl-CoA thioesterase II
MKMTDLPDVLQLDHLAPARFQVHMPAESAEGRDVVFSGQLLAQMLMAADSLHGPGKQARSIHATFARAATYTKPIELDVETILDGRSWASDTITAHQEGKVMARAEVLSNIVERDLLRHELDSPMIPGPDQAQPASSLGFPGTEWRDIKDDNLEIDGAAAMISWFRYPQVLNSVAANQAVLAWSTCGALIGLALRGNNAINISQAHVTISTGVMAHTVHFVEDFDANEWMSISQHTIHAGRGRVHGRGLVRTQDGQLVATFHQDAMARHFEGSLDPRRSM